MPVTIGYITTASEKDSKRIATALLAKRYIACANIVPRISSMFWWKGKIRKQKESLLIVKTQHKWIEEIIKEVKRIHGYEVPCIEFWQAERANAEFEKWVESETP